jgi:ankyrin repeat protein
MKPPRRRGGSLVPALLCLALASPSAPGYELDRDTWLLPPEPDASLRPPREQRPFLDPLELSRIDMTGNDRLPEYAVERDAELVAAAARGDRPAVEKLLAAGANPNRARDPYGDRALPHAVMRGDVEIVRVLLDAGAEPNLPGAGMTPLGLAALGGHARIAGMLLAAGADPDRKDRDGNRPLYSAALLDHADVIRALLPHDPDFDLFNAGLPGFEGLTALGAAAFQGSVAALRALLDGGADVEALDEAGRPALFYAVTKRQRGAIRVLLEYGAQAGGMAVDAY